MRAHHKITVVSGLPRSGTSLMMQMLAAGGHDVLVDHVRQADHDNPEGYYEYEPVKGLSKGDGAWVEDARGKAIKVISALLQFLPPQYGYDIIFMHRTLPEILASQRKMLIQRGEPTDSIADEKLADLCTRHLHQVERWLSAQPNVRVLPIHYRELIQDSAHAAAGVNAFLGGWLDEAPMVGAVDPRLYRNRAP